LYRWNAVGDWLESQHLSVAEIHAYVQNLQHCFLKNLLDSNLNLLCPDSIVPPLPIKSPGIFSPLMFQMLK
jgi:hypothetical protein